MVRVVALDYDGTLADTFRGRNPAIIRLKEFLVRRYRPLYLLLEMVEACVLFFFPPRLHLGAHAFICELARRGFIVGVITDRSLFSFIISSRRARLPLKKLSFIHARRSIFDWFGRGFLPEGVRVFFLPEGVRVFMTPHYKGEPRALCGLERFLRESRIGRHEVCLVGDDARDRLAAAHSGFMFLLVNRHRPDFGQVWRLIHRLPS